MFGALDFGQYRVYSYNIITGATLKISDNVVRTHSSPSREYSPLHSATRFTSRPTMGSTMKSSGHPTARSREPIEVVDLKPGTASSLPRWLTVFNGELYFGAAEPVAGNEPRAYNGTSLRLVADLNPGSAGSAFNAPAILGNYLIFEANGPAGLRPWFTAGSAATTDIVRTSGRRSSPSTIPNSPSSTARSTCARTTARGTSCGASRSLLCHRQRRRSRPR